MLLNLAAVFGLETDLAKKEVEDLKGQVREKESDLEYAKNLFESLCASLKEKEQQEEDIEAPQMSNVPHPSIDCFRYFVCVFVFVIVIVIVFVSVLVFS